MLTCLIDDDADLIWRLAAGAALGWTLTSLGAYIFASVLGLGPLVVLLSLALALAPLGLLRRPAVRRMLAHGARSLVSPGSRVGLIGLAVTAVFVALLCGRAFYIESGGIYVGDDHNFGDLSMHLAITCDFLFGQRFPPEHPSLSGASLTYPFLMDFGVAVLVTGGLPLRDAYLVESAVLFVGLLVLLHHWARLLSGDRLAARLAVVLFVCSGGLGWWTYLRDASRSGDGLIGHLMHLTRDYTIAPDPALGLRWGNTVTTLLLTQRTLLLGLSLALIVFTLWWRAMSVRDGSAVKRLMLAGGVVTGLLPLAHAHSFLVVMGLGAGMATLFLVRTALRRGEGPVEGDLGWRPWVMFAATALAIGLPQIFWVMSGSRVQNSGFFAWHPGWDSADQPFMAFWLYNTGLLIPLVLVALFARERGERLVPSRAAWFYAPFVLCFVVPNLFKLAPWVWDNIKVLVYWFLASVPIVACLLARLLRLGPISRIVAMAALVVLTASGCIDIWRVLDGQVSLRIIDRDGIEFAQQVRRVTPNNAIILRAAVVNHPLVLSGRRCYLGYPGHVWSQGLSADARENTIKIIYAGGAPARVLLKKLGIEYVAVGPQERATMPVDDAFFPPTQAVASVGPYTLYHVTASP